MKILAVGTLYCKEMFFNTNKIWSLHHVTNHALLNGEMLSVEMPSIREQNVFLLHVQTLPTNSLLVKKNSE